MLFRILFGGFGPTVLFTLPRSSCPSVMAGIHLLGAVSAEALLAAFYDGLRLATMIICVGAANSLANPKRLLASVPPALYEIGTVLVVSVSVFPQLAESVVRVRRARPSAPAGIAGGRCCAASSFRCWPTRSTGPCCWPPRWTRAATAGAADVPERQRVLTSTLLTVGILGLCVGIYGMLDGTTPRYLGLPMVAGGVVVGAAGFALAGRRVQRTRYRPDRWRVPELFVAACGVVAGTAVWVTSRVDPGVAHPSLYPISWPQITLLPLLGILVAALPAVLTPPPPGAAGTGGPDRPAGGGSRRAEGRRRTVRRR